MNKPYVFDAFFSSGLEESVSPFLIPSSRKWGRNLSLKSALFSAFFLSLSFGFSFFNPSLSYFFLSFVYFLSGIPALLASLKDLKNLEINIDVLMTLAAFVALWMDSGLEGALLLVLFELSHSMEESVSHKAKAALHHLNVLAPKFATVIGEDGIHFEKSVREIQVGQCIFVKQGEIVPLDGKIVEGTSSVNLVHLTGESLPVTKKPGESVPAGARNLDAALSVQVERTSDHSTLTKIIQLITQAQEAKPKLQRFFDRFSQRYASAVILLTALFALTLPFLFPIDYLGSEGAVYRSLAFLIAASPCALIIAIPTAYLSALSASAKKGILLKGAIILDALAKCRSIAFDKTGTLTLGELICLSMETLEPNPTISPEKALSIAYGMERQVVHPIAKAIVAYAASKKLSPAEISHFRSVPGYGLEGAHGHDLLFIGLPAYLKGKISPEQEKKIEKWRIEASAAGDLLATLLIGKEIFCFRFSDQVRPEAVLLIEELKEKHALSPLMLTGDHEESAKSVAEQLGIETVLANLRPEDKLEKVASLAETEGLAMVGDGVNDAPALARATVGISLGKIGSASAIDASDVVLLNDDISSLSWLFSKAAKTQKIVRQNLVLALCVICLATTPALLGLVPLWAAVLLHEGGTVLVGLNSLRLFRD